MKTYEPPSVTVLGTLADLTRAAGGHNVLDADFNAGTHHDNLTFS
jgi:hypothetical protein